MTECGDIERHDELKLTITMRDRERKEWIDRWNEDRYINKQIGR
jgi:hypothetical protein